MTSTMTNQEHRYLHKVYRNITCLGILLHSMYSIVFLVLQYPIPFIYNVLDICFYVTLMMIVTKLNRYTLAVTLIHLETIVFCLLHTVLFGWDPSFYIYLIAMASLVYFCPYRLTYIPYIFSLLHIIVFFLLYWYAMNASAFYEYGKLLNHIFFAFNGISAFIIILYVAYVSKASASVGRKELLEQNKDLQHLTNYDQMTGLYNRTCLRNRYTQPNERTILAIGDIDDFKAINDTYGHICGDIILKELAEQMRAKLDPNIFLCRWGGEEFVFIFPYCTLADAKHQLTEFCHWISEFHFQYQDQEIHITMTFGLSSRKNNQSLDKWIDDADHFLYQGKHSGKNKVLSENEY